MPRFLVASFVVSMFLLRIEPPSGMESPAGAPAVLTTEAVSPELGRVVGVELAEASNNLDVVRHQGRSYLAFRTAPTHFASRNVRLYVVSSADERNWRLETTVALGRDVREPRLLSFEQDGVSKLFMYFAVLGTDLLSFDPQKMMGVARGPDGTWSAPRDVYRPGFIPWRTRTVAGRPYMLSYGDGRHIYARDGVPVEIHWLTTADGWNWQPVTAGQPAVLKGGGSEADFVDLPDGGLVAVVRNEAGDGGAWGSKVCKATAGAPGRWSCQDDKRKFDSPLLFRRGADVFLVARRHLSGSGDYDLGMRWLPPSVQTAAYQLDYWRYPKRCALWRVDPATLDVRWQVDLPSRGDTCFPAVPGDPASADGGQETVTIYNYSSPLDGPDVPWLAGQLGRTWIYRSVVRLGPSLPITRL
jgi:hypothetical protein